MSFAHPDWLWLLAGLPLLVVLEWRAASAAERRLAQLTGARKEPVLLEQRIPGVKRASLLLRASALALLAVGAAGPEWGYELVRRSALGSEVVLALDVSASMDVRDVPPSRLEEARREALAVLDQMAGSKVGVVAFAGDAVRLCPLTLDRSAARLVLESLSSSTVSEPGTDLGKGLRAAAQLLPQGSRADQAIVIWTDGEDLEQGARRVIEDLGRTAVRVFAVGVGTPTGDVVPVLDDQGRVVDVKREEDGGPHRSRLDERVLQALARTTRGAYFSAARPGGELPRLLASLAPVSRTRRGAVTTERLVERPVPRFPWLAGAAALLLAGEAIRRRRRTLSGGAVAPAARAAALAIGLLLPLHAEAQSDWARGDAAFRRGQWAAAESLYSRRLRRGAPPEVRVNLATARARRGRLEQAREDLRRAAVSTGRAGQVASYNLGTLQAEQRAWDDALRDLRRALERDPSDEDARFNYEWVLRERERERQRQEQQRAPQQRPQQPQPQQPQPQGGGQDQPQPQSPGAQPPQQPAPPPEMGRGMDRRQAEQLLGSLQELERLEQRRLRQVRVMRERRGRDW